MPQFTLARPPLEERTQLAAARRMPQLAQRLGFDLPDAFARDGEALADFFQRVLAAVADAEAHLNDLLFARRECLKDRLGLFLQVQVDDRFGRRDDLAIFDEVAKMRIFLLANRRFERDRLLRDLQDLADLADRNVHALGNLFGGRFAAKLLHERTRGANELVDRLDHVHRDADGARLVGDRPGDGLADPPRRVRRELVAAAVLELVDRLHQADVAFLNQIEELEASIRVLLRNRDDETEVGFDQLLLGLLRLVLAAQDRVERLLQLARLLLERVGHGLELEALFFLQTLEVFLLFLAQLRLLPALRVENPLVAVDLALDGFHRLDGVFHLVDETPFDGFRELDHANGVRHLDERALGLPPAAAVLAFLTRVLALRRFLKLLIELLVIGARLADGIDLLLDLLAALRNALVGDLLVVEDTRLADRPFAGVQLVAEVDDFLRDERRVRNGLDHRQLAALDAPRDLDFALAREQRHRPHLAQVHADRVVGLVKRARREIELDFLRAFTGPIDRLLVTRVLLVRVDDFDAGAAERVEQVVKFF